MFPVIENKRESGSEYGRYCTAGVWSSRYWLELRGFMDARISALLDFSSVGRFC